MAHTGEWEQAGIRIVPLGSKYVVAVKSILEVLGHGDAPSPVPASATNRPRATAGMISRARNGGQTTQRITRPSGRQLAAWRTSRQAAHQLLAIRTSSLPRQISWAPPAAHPRRGTAPDLPGPASTAAARSHAHAPRRAASGTNDTPTCHKEREEMSQPDFEPDANPFRASPEFTNLGFSTSEDDTWTSHEHPGNTGQYAPGGWGSPHEYGQPEDMNGQGVFVPGHDDTWETAPTPPFGTPRHGRARRIRLGPLAIAALALISLCAITVITLPHARVPGSPQCGDPSNSPSSPPRQRPAGGRSSPQPPSRLRHHQDRRRARPG